VTNSESDDNSDDNADADRTPRHVLVACDKFKGTLSAREVAA
jgi:hypothetical protein